MNSFRLLQKFRFASFSVLAILLTIIGAVALPSELIQAVTRVLAEDRPDQAVWQQQREKAFMEWKSAKREDSIPVDELKRKTFDLIAASRKQQQSPADNSPLIWRVPKSPKEIWDCPTCPRITIVPAGEYTMGSPESETCRNPDQSPQQGPVRNPAEGPQHRVTIDYPLGVATFLATRGEFAAFVAETGYDAVSECKLNGNDRAKGCWGWDGEKVGPGPQYSWQNPGHSQTLDDPVTTLSWGDAQAYISWLSKKTGHTYRLLSEAEWEYAARAGTTTATPWGEKPARDYANFGHDGCNGTGPLGPGTGGADHWEYTSPVGSFPPNNFGLYDMLGNALEWVEDCNNQNYDRAPSDGSAWVTGDCSLRVLRGGVWLWGAGQARSAYRHTADPNHRGNLDGFRVARVL